MTYLRIHPLCLALGVALLGACGGDDDGTTRDGGGTPDAGRTDGGMRDAPSTDAPGTDAPATDAPATDAPGDDGGGGSDGGALECTMGTETPIGQLCVTDASTADGAVTFQVVPMGCLSSSCTIRHLTTCSVSRSGSSSDLTLSALFCLEGTGGGACTADCGGGGFANCEITLEAGTYTATLDGLSVTFTVPSDVSGGTACDGSPF